MCDCEELEFEDFQEMLAELSKAPAAKVPVEPPVIQVARSKRGK
jgi:hypothetical protein